MAGIEIVTKQDLIELEERLISEIRKTNGTGEEQKKLLKSYQVKNLLKISPGTLQNLRVNGTLPFTKVGGIIYYKYEDIMKIFDPAKERTKGGR
ncbi:DNA-binding protein [Mucilaginibacter limnophilus]|uniref:DNA-binding protein n=1 Tax=Mucilaginibacter limnophilus TaxID=1932778 RepID=A0A3S2WXF1_9SPHI|nr:helix-turn-helix domain-containing protein [Mucilaginibacter limnophilus]RVU00274.1 DNA-binding protein [Mucilaginibacter limnophilus]